MCAQRLRYMISQDCKTAFTKIDTSIRGYTSRVGVIDKAYGMIRSFAASQVQRVQRGRGIEGEEENCSVATAMMRPAPRLFVLIVVLCAYVLEGGYSEARRREAVHDAEVHHNVKVAKKVNDCCCSAGSDTYWAT